MTEDAHAKLMPAVPAPVTHLPMLRRVAGPRPVVNATEALAHADALHNLARHLARSEADAEDLVQETYARAFGAPSGVEPGTNVKAWLFRILRNAFFDRMRRERRAGVHVSLAGGEAEPIATDDAWTRGELDAEAMRRLVGEDLEAALLELSEDARTVVLLDLEGFTEAEIALVLECAAGTVKSRLSRARAALRRRLADYARAP